MFAMFSFGCSGDLEFNLVFVNELLRTLVLTDSTYDQRQQAF
jgi:hypothetical protein